MSEKIEMPVINYVPGTITTSLDAFAEAMKSVVEVYKNKTYTENEIALAKADRATLNKVRKQVNDKKIEIKKSYMEPYTQFENKVKEVLASIDEASYEIDTVVKHAEEKAKEAKRASIIETWNLLNPPVNSIDPFWNEKWLNKTYRIENIRVELTEIADKVRRETGFIMTFDEPKRTAVLNLYTSCGFNLSTAQMQYEEQERRKAEREAELQRMKEQAAKQPVKQPDPIPVVHQEIPKVVDTVATERKTETIYVRAFRTELTREQLLALADFCNTNNIRLNVTEKSQYEREI